MTWTTSYEKQAAIKSEYNEYKCSLSKKKKKKLWLNINENCSQWYNVTEESNGKKIEWNKIWLKEIAS